MTDEQIRQMVSRFLAWRLPKDFSPDGGISFERTFNGVNGATLRATPSGTNLLNFNQAMDMVRHMASELAAVQPAQGDYFEGLEEGIKIGRGEPQPDPRVVGYEQAYQYALTLADALMAKHYPDNKDWKPLGDLTGILTQIDNMVAGKMPDPRDGVIKGLVDAATEALSELESGGKTMQTVHNLRAAVRMVKAHME